MTRTCGCAIRDGFAGRAGAAAPGLGAPPRQPDLQSRQPHLRKRAWAGTNVQIAPSFGPEGDALNASARLTIGKRISNRAYLTYARALGGTTTGVRDQIITVEYDQSERLGFVITQTGNNTYAIEFRVRHVF